MLDTFRLAFSIGTMIAFACTIAGILLVIGTWGDFLHFFVWSLGALLIAGSATVIASL